jgi:hypothetical protein
MSAAGQTLLLLRALPVRSLGYVLASVSAIVFLGGVAAGSGWTMSFDADLGVPVVLTGAMVALAGGLLWIVGGAAGLEAAARRSWRRLGLALLAIGAEQALSLHERLEEGLQLGAAAAYGPLFLLAAVALSFATALPACPERRALALALAIWLGVVFVEAAGRSGGAAAGLLSLVAAPLLLLSALSALQRFRREGAIGVTPEEAARALLLRVDAGRLAIGIVIALGAMLGLATLYHADVLSLQSFDLRSQQGVNTFASTTLFLTAGGLALLRGRLSDDPWYAWTLLGGAFVAMTAIELLALHQEIGDATGVRGQFVLFPVVIAAGLAWLACARLAGGPIRPLLVAGAALWAASQAIDVTSPEGYFHWRVLPEETLELLGTTLFVTALLLAVQETARSAAPRAGDGPDSAHAEDGHAALAEGG